MEKQNTNLGGLSLDVYFRVIVVFWRLVVLMEVGVMRYIFLLLYTTCLYVAHADTPKVEACDGNGASNIEFIKYEPIRMSRAEREGVDLLAEVVLQVIVSPDGILKDSKVISSDFIRIIPNDIEKYKFAFLQIFNRSALEKSREWEFSKVNEKEDRCGIVTLYIDKLGAD